MPTYVIESLRGSKWKEEKRAETAKEADEEVQTHGEKTPGVRHRRRKVED